MTTILEQPRPFSPDAAAGLAAPLAMPSLGSVDTPGSRRRLPSEYLRAWLEEHPVPNGDDEPFMVWRRRAADHDRAREMALAQVQGRPLSAVSFRHAAELRTGAEASRRMQRAPGRLVRIAASANRLARDPAEIVRWFSRGGIRHLPIGETEDCRLCVETFGDWPPAR